MSIRVAILAAAFNEQIVGPMIGAAADEVRRRGGEVVKSVRVPGAYELPLPAKRLLADPDVDLLVVLGFIERGETLHGEVMGHAVHHALLDLELAHDKPIGLGIIGPGATPSRPKRARNPTRAPPSPPPLPGETLQMLGRAAGAGRFSRLTVSPRNSAPSPQS